MKNHVEQIIQCILGKPSYSAVFCCIIDLFGRSHTGTMSRRDFHTSSIHITKDTCLMFSFRKSQYHYDEEKNLASNKNGWITENQFIEIKAGNLLVPMQTIIRKQNLQFHPISVAHQKKAKKIQSTRFSHQPNEKTFRENYLFTQQKKKKQHRSFPIQSNRSVAFGIQRLSCSFGCS